MPERGLVGHALPRDSARVAGPSLAATEELSLVTHSAGWGMVASPEQAGVRRHPDRADDLPLSGALCGAHGGPTDSRGCEFALAASPGSWRRSGLVCNPQEVLDGDRRGRAREYGDELLAADACDEVAVAEVACSGRPVRVRVPSGRVCGAPRCRRASFFAASSAIVSPSR